MNSSTKPSYLNFFSGKHCIITGASSGIGRLLATTLASYSVNLLLVARNKSALEETARMANMCAQSAYTENDNRTDADTDSASPSTLNNTVYTISADISTVQGVAQVKKYAQQIMPTIDFLVLNAGASMHSLISESTATLYKKMLDANFYTAVYMCNAFLTNIREKKGTIVAITSIQSLIGVPYHGAYVAAKHATSGFLESLELEEPDISIVEILPGWVSGTNIRNHAINGKGDKLIDRENHKRHSRSSITVEECVSAIIDGMYKKKRLVFKPNFWKNILFVKYAMRGYLHWLITRRQQYSSSD